VLVIPRMTLIQHMFVTLASFVLGINYTPYQSINF